MQISLRTILTSHPHILGTWMDGRFFSGSLRPFRWILALSSSLTSCGNHHIGKRYQHIAHCPSKRYMWILTAACTDLVLVPRSRSDLFAPLHADRSYLHRTSIPFRFLSFSRKGSGGAPGCKQQQQDIVQAGKVRLQLHS